MLADLTDFWWDPKRPDQPGLWESRVKLSETVSSTRSSSHPVPLEMNTLGALKRSSLGLDLYLWLTYRTFTLDAPLRLTWPQLYRQLGARTGRGQQQQTPFQAFRYKVSPRAEKDQDRVARTELLDQEGRPDPLSLDAQDPAVKWGTAAHRIGRSCPSARPSSALGTPG